VSSAATGGTILVLGLDDQPLGLSARTLVRRQLDLRGSLTYDHPLDFEHTIDLVGSAKLDPARVVGQAFALADVQHAFDEAPRLPGKTWVSFAAVDRETVPPDGRGIHPDDA
jgi:alcohol dehydrogenase/L-iditol 2-dehydrogenase